MRLWNIAGELAKKHADSPQSNGNALTLVVPIIAGREAALSELLSAIGNDVRHNPHVPFRELTLVHFMRWVVLPAPSSGGSASLAMESNHDGTAREHLIELLAHAAAGVHAIYSHCVGYPVPGAALPMARHAEVIDFLLARAVPYCAFYVSVPGASVAQIRHEAEIRSVIEAYLNEQAASQAENGATEPDLHALVRDAERRVRADARLSAALDNADDSSPLHPLRLAAGVVGALWLSPALITALCAIRVKEVFDTQTDQVSIPDAARGLMAREDLQIQNQLTHLVPLKPGTLRAVSTRVVLGAIDFLAHELFTRGNLGGISSIHFARWVLVDEGTRLLFFSNYDGSWESYLGDFIDKASLGLTSVWSNTEEFPNSVFLLFKGATDEERFKAWTRAHQVPTQAWYSAYPELTVRNILNNRAIAAELRRRPKSPRAVKRWLKRF